MPLPYDPATDVGRVRFKIGDVTEPFLVDDSVIEAFLANGTVTSAAIECCEGLAAFFARDIDFQTDDQKFERNKRAETFRKLAAQLRTEGGGDLATVKTTRVDGYSSDIDNEETVETMGGGRLFIGYNDPDEHP